MKKNTLIPTVAPNGPPKNVKASPLSPTQITIMWEPPMIQNRLGIIVSYDVTYTAKDPSGTVIEEQLVNINTGLRTVLNGLHEYTNYSISVRARTAVGPGPFSTTIIMVLTDETSESDGRIASIMPNN